VNDSLLVGVLNGMADLDEEVQPLFVESLFWSQYSGDSECAHQFP